METNKQILVYYISTAGLEDDEIGEYFDKLKDKIAVQSISEDSEIIFIPINGETRIECINPKYITDGDLIKQHERAMSFLQEELNHQIKQLPKKEKDGER